MVTFQDRLISPMTYLKKATQSDWFKVHQDYDPDVLRLQTKQDDGFNNKRAAIPIHKDYRSSMPFMKGVS
ncbi:MAG: hypothetical protein A2Z14_02535 [Chloroflexi bacterium RBG_16_48_8]|nr:MAG: hypothetical protein A2Z14_02535 [Chloroflexi bacterium RBG_16_48_8]